MECCGLLCSELKHVCHAGVWATVQFKFLQLQYPPVALALERLLLSATLPLGAAVQTWGVVSAVGASAAAYYLAVLLALMYYALVLPLPSSFYKSQASQGIGAPLSINSAPYTAADGTHCRPS